MLQHEPPDRRDQTVRFGERDELVRRDQAAFRMLPANQRLESGDPVGVMILGAGPADVETVIVGGDVVKRDGKLAGDQVGHALELMYAARNRLRA